MILYLNMTSRVTLGNVFLPNVNSFEVNENVDEISDNAKIVIPKNYKALAGKSILEQLKVGDPVKIESGYEDEYEVEFEGYIKEIDSDLPLTIYCEDAMYLMRQDNHVRSYQSATLKQVLKDILPPNITVDCPDITLGKLMLDNVSTFRAIQQIKEEYGIYSRMKNNVLTANLRDVTVNSTPVRHTCVLNPGDNISGYFAKKNELKYKRKEDFKLTVEISSLSPDGKRTTVAVGNKEKDAAKISITYPGKHTEAELKRIATSMYDQRCYDGYRGSITGFGYPRTHAGDSLIIIDREDEGRKGCYFIEKVAITYDESGGFSRKNELSYQIPIE